MRCSCASRPYPTYRLPPGEQYPMFFRKRVYQGSSGRVYPLAFHAALSDERVDDPWEFITLENPWLTVELLPQLGGRIFAATERQTGYDLFYRQPVIKPALVGLTGPWISGGVEFNWPQHHRPTTYLPADRTVERHDDGSVTVWMGEHEPMDRMKEAHGVRLDPHSSRIELNVRLFNRTPMRHSVMWWANLAAETHERYQAFFPPDVDHVADHAVRAMSSFPIARNDYYGIDYRPGTDLTWYRNIPVPTSYMVLRSDYAFFGGYDHAADAGFVHVADRHVAPGKKQWTWGNAEFGRAWDRELTDARDDGSHPPYVELMAGVYTNNQPDFTYLGPYETKTFRQVWWPIRGLGPVQQANERAALMLSADSGTLRYGVASSEPLQAVELVLSRGGEAIERHRLDLQSSEGVRFELDLLSGHTIEDFELALEHDGDRLLSYRPARSKRGDEDLPDPATEPPAPEDVESADRLYFIGEHVEQYRHPTRRPEPYWQEAIRRDPGDTRSRLALGRRCLRHGKIDEAIEHLEAARARSTEWHPNPESGEAAYLLGLCYRRRGEASRAEDCFGKAAWDRAFASPAALQMAQIMSEQGRCGEAMDRARQSLAADPGNQTAACLVAALLRRAGDPDAGRRRCDAVLARDPLSAAAMFERSLCLRSMGETSAADEAFTAMLEALADASQTMLDVALDYAHAGLWDDAIAAVEAAPPGSNASAAYARWWFAEKTADPAAATRAAQTARSLTQPTIYPVRPMEELILAEATDRLTDDANAPYLLGCLLYDRQRIADAKASWSRCIERDPGHAGALRGLGLIACNDAGEPRVALDSFEAAFASASDDDRLLYELDQLRGRCGIDAEKRLASLDSYPALVARRDDLTLERIHLLNLMGREGEALAMLSERRFHPWEGGEGKALAEHAAACLGLGMAAMEAGLAPQAVAHFTAATAPPDTLGEARHPLAAMADVEAHLGWALLEAGETDDAHAWLELAVATSGDFSEMAVQAFSPMAFFKGWSLRLLGRSAEAREVFESLLEHARSSAKQLARIDYFATSLPNLLVFEEDTQRRHEIDCRYLEALALRGLAQIDEADALLRRVAEEDTNHLGSRQMLRWGHLVWRSL
ncbi:MAG: DUF5107 domain-containing protein [Planctomycetota bacterium]